MKSLVLLTALLLPLPLLAADLPPPAGSKDLRQLLQEGLFEEEANRDLEKAAAAYAGIVARYGEQRALAATALFRLAEIRVKQGKKDEASALFQQLLTDFPGQEALGKEARARLAALGAKVPAGAPAWSPETVAKLEQDLIALRLAETSLSTSLKPQHPKMIELREKIAATERLLHPETVPPSAPKAPTEAEAKELAVVREMAKNSPDLLNAVTDKTTPLVRAASNGWLEVARFLLDHGARLDAVQKVEPPLFAAARKGHKAVVELLLARGAEVNAKFAGDRTPLIEACDQDRAEVARLLVDGGAELNVVTTFGTTALLGASAASNLPLAKLLLERGADPNATPASGDGTPLLKAVELRQEAMVKLLLEFHADPNLANSPQGRAPLHAAARENMGSIIEQLLAHGAKIDLADSEGRTALHMATAWWLRRPEMARLLLERGASPHLRTNSEQFTPLHFSVALDREQTDAHRQVPGDVAALRQVWEALLAKGAEINAQDAEGKTVLHHAMAWTQLLPENALWLIEHGADWKLEDNNHTTPLGYATSAERRLFFEQRLVFPNLAKERTVAIAVRLGTAVDGEQASIQAETDSASPPTVADVLRRALVRELDQSKVGVRVGGGLVIRRPGAQIVGAFDLIILRSAAGAPLTPAARIEINISDRRTDPTPWPALQWGDVVVLLETGKPNVSRNPPEIDAWLTERGFPPKSARPAPVSNPELEP